MDNKGKSMTFIIVIYLTMLSISMSALLLWRFISLNLSTYLLILVMVTVLIVNLFISLYNIIFLFKKKKLIKDWYWVLLFNSIYSIISGFNIRMFGFVIINNYGIDFSPFFIKNQAGIGYGFHYHLINMIWGFFPYDVSKVAGFRIEINIIILALGITFLFFLKRLRNANRTVIAEV